MNWLDRLVGRKTQALTELPHFYLGADSKTGIAVNWVVALQVATVFACARALAEGVAQVPWKVYQARDPGPGADERPKHDLHRLVYRRPNGWQTSFELRETLMLHLVLCGNAYAYKNVVGSGRIHELIPLMPGNVQVTRRADMSLTYRVTFEDGSSREVPAELIWHIRGPSWNGWLGLEPVRLAREAIGLNLALEESHALLHKNGAQTSGTYSVEGELKEAQYEALTKWIKRHVSGDMKHMPLILDRAAKWTAQQMTGVDAQHLETRRHQIEEVCRFMRVFPQMVGHAGNQTPTFASAEQFFQAHVIHSLGPWYERLEQSADVNLFGKADQDAGYFVKFKIRGLMRGAIKDQGTYFAQALGAGGAPAWMTQDEVRDEAEGLNPMGGPAAELREPTNVAKTAPAKDPADA